MEGRGQIAALLPAAGLLTFALYCGTFAGGASAGGAVVAHLILWLAGFFFALLVAIPGRGRGTGKEAWQSGAILLVAWAGVALPWWASPVPRAGSSAVVLVPLFLILPWLVAWCWRDSTRAARGVFGVGLVVAAVAARGLWGWMQLGTDGASLPLGHHNLLAAFLVTTLPLAALGWRSRGLFRWVGSSSVVVGVVTLLATRSLAGAAALAAVVIVGGLSHRSGSRRSLGWALLVAIGTVVGLGLVFGHRILSVIAGADPSTSARLGYWRAGIRGVLERPLFGWGPGSTPWTVHAQFQPVPGVHPPDQVLADLHSLPLQMLYELGLAGCGLLALAVAGTWWVSRRRRVEDRGLVAAGVAGWVGFCVVSLGGLPLSVTAVPVAASLALGAVLAGLGVEAGRRYDWTFRSLLLTVITAVVLTLAALVLQPQDKAHLAYERATLADSDDARTSELQAATALDPDFPLYAWHLALELDDQAIARGAAESAPSVAALRLSAGDWDDACRLSRLGTVASFQASLESDDPSVFARALVAQPWLLAAVEWRDHTDLVDQAVALLMTDPRVEIGWRGELRDAWVRIRAMEGEATSIRRLVLDVDDVPATSLSLHTFRRSPWPARIAEIRLDAARLGPVSAMVSAALLPTTDPSLFRSSSCALGSR